MTARIEVRLYGEIAERFAEEAEQRGTTPSKLLRQLIEILLEDSLIDAVLDEREADK